MFILSALIKIDTWFLLNRQEQRTKHTRALGNYKELWSELKRRNFKQ